MKMNYNLTGTERKALVKAIEELTGEKAKYMGMPSAAFQIGGVTISKTGELTGDFDENLIAGLARAGFEGEADEEEIEETISDAGAEEPDADAAEDTEDAGGEEKPSEEADTYSLTVKVPMEQHTGCTIRNLINLVYTRAGLINKALGTGFRVDSNLVELLQDDEKVASTDILFRAIADFEDEYGKAIDGLILTPEDITFASLPETNEPERIRAFTELVGMMNTQALTQKRIQAKEITEPNEKYALRIWLTRLGMNGDEFKRTRKILMQNLSGHSAFHTEADKERWNQRQAEKKAAAKAQEVEA